MAAEKLFIHDIRAVACTFGPLLINEGLGEEAFTIERPEAFTMKEGADGAVTRMATNKRSATIKIKLQAASRHNKELEALFQQDRLTPNGAGVRPFALYDLNGTELYQYSAAWISQPAGTGKGLESAEREWTVTAVNEAAQG